MSSVARLFDIVQTFFKIDSKTLRMACSRSWNEIFCNCMGSMNIQDKVLLGFCSLENTLMDSIDPFIKKTAAFCIYEFVAMQIYLDEKLVVSEVFPRVVALFEVNFFSY